MEHSFLVQLVIILSATVMLGVAIFLLSHFERLFLIVRNKWLRKNLAVLSIAIFFMIAFVAMQSPGLIAAAGSKGLVSLLLNQLLQIIVVVVFVFNIIWLISNIRVVKNLSFVKYHIIIILSIIIAASLIYSLLNYLDNGMKFKNLHASLVFAYFNSLVTGLIYTAVNYVELERKRKLNEKELEVTRLMALKTKAELDALHSKINPHFLYNALNSIADLSITDGKKARKMTIALADLFRYSINYSNNNYSTVRDEVEMANVYLQIEKIRFEDKLTYILQVEEGIGDYLVPRFILQPLVENAVKHGLKATGQMTEIKLEVKREANGLVMNVADTGPAFPDTLNPGYGVKSVYDKLDLLFPGKYEIHFSNNPVKHVSLHIHKLAKDESGI